MIEIEFSAVSRQCLNRRTASKEELKNEVLTIAKERTEKAVKINGQFSIETARMKLNEHYEKVNPENEKHLIT